MKRVLLFSLVASATLLPARAIEAQRIDSPYRFLDYGQQVGVYVGRMGAEEGPLQIGPQPATTLGARWALRVSGPLSLGAEVGYTPTTRTVRSMERPGSSRSVATETPGPWSSLFMILTC